MLVLGVDENGMGPKLGPLVATAALVEVRRYDASKLRERGVALGIGDSKRMSAFGHMTHAEGLALALAERFGDGVPENAEALLGALGLDGPLALRAPCPAAGSSAAQCWAPLRLPAFGGSVASGRTLLAKLEGRTLRVRRIRSALACAGILNDALAEGRNKLRVDLELFERLILDARAASGEELHCLCGIIGGLRKYQPAFRRLRAEVLLEEKGVSAYQARGVGDVRFEVKADDRHLPVGLASMVGKYVRELQMERMRKFYQGHDAALRSASGYHDPVTAAFVEKSAPLRRRLAIAERCFERLR